MSNHKQDTVCDGLLSDISADITAVKRNGEWKSTGIAERYIHDAISYNSQTTMKIQLRR